MQKRVSISSDTLLPSRTGLGNDPGLGVHEQFLFPLEAAGKKSGQKVWEQQKWPLPHRPMRKREENWLEIFRHLPHPFHA